MIKILTLLQQTLNSVVPRSSHKPREFVSRSSGDSGTRAQTESSITIYTVERKLAYFVYLCH